MAYTEGDPRVQLTCLPESNLIHFAQLGSEAAFQELAIRTRAGCIRQATAILRNPNDAEDEVQNALWKAYTHLGHFSQQCKFSTWVTRIVINHCLMRYRRMRRKPLVFFDRYNLNGSGYTVYEPTDSETPESEVARDELRGVLRGELRLIPPLLRVPLELRYMEGQSIENVAMVLGISIAAAKSRLHRAHSYLRERMLRHCGHRGPASLTCDE